MRLRAWKTRLACGFFLACLTASAAAEPTPLPGLKQEAGDAPELFKPARERSESQQDHVKASALFAHGRLLFQREDYDGALRRYQRAYRYDPLALHVLGEIVPLAFELKRNEEAARYAVIAAEKDSQDALLLRRLAMHLSEQQDYERALKLFQKSIELQKNPDEVSTLLLHLEMGRLKFIQKDFPGAADSFGRVREAIADPKKFGLSPELEKILLGNANATYSLLGESFFQIGKYDDAAAMFQKAHEALADAPKLAYQRARIAAKRGNIDETLKQLDQYFVEKGTTSGADPYKLLAETLEKKLGDAKAAREALREKLKTLHAADSGNVALATAYTAELRTAGALEEAVAILAPLNEKELHPDAVVLLISLYRSLGKMPELLAILGKSAGRSGTLEVLDEVADEVIKDQALIEKLIAAARQKRQEKPENLTPGEALAVALLAMEAKQYDAGDEFFAIVAARPPISRRAVTKSEMVLAWGIAMIEAEQYGRAARVFRNAIENNQAKDREELCYYFLAGALELEKKTDEALAAIDKLYSAEKSSARLISRKAWILYHAKRHAEAEKVYIHLLSRFENDHKTPGLRETLREARLVLSNICVLTDRRPAAIEYLEQVLDEFPEDVGAMNDLGYLWAEVGQRPERALAMTQFAVAKEPKNAAYRDSLGWALYQRGMFAEAVAELEKAAEFYRAENPEGPDGVIFDHLGDAYHKLGQADKALANWRLAVTAFEKDKEAAKLKATQEKLAQHEKK